MTANRFAVLYDSDLDARVVDVARGVLADIPACFRADYSVKRIGGAPVLLVQFNEPEAVMRLKESSAHPAVFVRLVTVPKGQLLAPGQPLEGDRLRRHVRDSVEHYLAKHGIRVSVDE